jgi:hypothetical protein
MVQTRPPGKFYPRPLAQRPRPGGTGRGRPWPADPTQGGARVVGPEKLAQFPDVVGHFFARAEETAFYPATGARGAAFLLEA